MARSVIAPQNTGRDPASATLVMTTADGTNKHEFVNKSENLFLLIKNDHTSSQTVTIQRKPDLKVDGVTMGSLSVAVAAGKVAIVGPFPRAFYNQDDSETEKTGCVFIDPPASPTALTLAVFAM